MSATCKKSSSISSNTLHVPNEKKVESRSVETNAKFGQRKNRGELFTCSAKSFQNLRKIVMPKIQEVMFEVLDPKHQGEWLPVLDHVVQLMKQQHHSKESSADMTSARKRLPLEEFTDLLVVKKTAELFLLTSSPDIQDMLTHLLIGSLSLQETNELLEKTASKTGIVESKDIENTPFIAYDPASKDNMQQKCESLGVDKEFERNDDNPEGNQPGKATAVKGKEQVTSDKRSSYIISKANWNKIKKGRLNMLIRLNDNKIGNNTTCKQRGLKRNLSTLSNLSSSSLTSSSVGSSSTEDNEISGKSNMNLHGRLGLSAAAFAESAIVQRLIEAYRCAPNKDQKEDLLSLCVGTFTRQEVNDFIVKPHQSSPKRYFDQVTKVWWREIRQLAENRKCARVSKPVRKLSQLHPQKRIRHHAFNPRYEPCPDIDCDLITAGNSRDALPLARRYFLKGGLSMISPYFSDKLLQSSHPERDEDSSKINDDYFFYDEEDNNEPPEGGAEDREDINISHNFAFETIIEEDECFQNDDFEDDVDGMGVCIEEDDALFDFDQ